MSFDEASQTGALSESFESFAREIYRDSSPLYERLSYGVAADPEILSLAAHARNTPVSHLLFAAVHFLLLKGTRHPLSAFYPSIDGGFPSKSEDPYPYFRTFCLEHKDEIRTLISFHLVQTNEVRRCALLLPAFGLVDQATNRPLALVELGTSAGLNLLWDRYGYDYGDEQYYGDPNSPVQIACALRGSRRPYLPVDLPEVAFRTGADINPVDVRDPEAVLWLHALVWPEQYEERARVLQRAIQLARQEPPALVAGDALQLLPGILAEVPEDTALCVFHTFVVNQFSKEARKRLSSTLAAHAAERDVFWISVEFLGRKHPILELVSFVDGVRTRRRLARCSNHGEWLEWL